MPELANFLGKDKMFLVGDNITWVDFGFVEILELFQFVTEGRLYQHYPTLKRYIDNVMALPAIRDYLKTQNERKFNNKSAKINN